MNLSAPISVTGGGTQTVGTVKLHRLGTRAMTRDGRVFRYCRAGAVDLVAGNVLQGPADIPLHGNCAVKDTPVGSTSILVTPGAIGGAANLYEDGIAIVSTAPNLGQVMSIRSHGPITSATEFALNLSSDDPVAVALTTASKVDLVANPYAGVIQSPVTTLTGVVVGVAPVIIPANQYGWVQTWGPCGVLIDGTPAVGMAVSAPAAVAGGAAINSSTLAMIGWMMTTGVAGKAKAVYLTIAA